MGKDLHDIDKLFHEALEPNQDRPGKQVWENITRQLDKDEATVFKKRLEKFKRLSLVLILLLMGLGVYHFATVDAIRAKYKQPAANSSAGSSGDSFAENKKNYDHNRPGNMITVTQNSDPAVYANQTSGTNVPGNSTNVTDKNISGNRQGMEVTAQNPVGSSTRAMAVNDRTGLNNDNAGQKKTARVLSQNGKMKATTTDPLPFENNDTGNPVAGQTETGYNQAVISRLASPEVDKLLATKAARGSVLSRLLLATGPKVSTDSKTPVLQKPAKPVAKLKDLFSAGICYSYGFTANKLEDDNEHHSRDNRENIRNRESSASTSSFGLSINMKLSPRLSLESGVNYSVSKNNTGESKLFAEKDNDGRVRYRNNSSYGYCYLLPDNNPNPVVGDSIQASGGYSKVKYIEVPLMLNYAFGKKKLQLKPGVGISFGFLSGATSSAMVQQGTTSKTVISAPMQGLKKTNVSLLVSPQLQYKLSGKLAISAIPYMKYALQPVNKGTVVSTYPLNIGIGFGVNYKF